jgi:epoxide hydrolase-like predicted phosphatase
MRPTDFKNIIFDLGGVIINIAPEKTWESIAQLSGKTISEAKIAYGDLEIFAHLEEGKISGEEFLHTLSRHTGLRNPQLLESWNALLLDIPQERIELLLSLKQKHRTFLLSNTNELHVQAIQAYLKQAYSLKLEDLFEQVFLSNEIKLRKPYSEIYAHLVACTNIKPKESVFIDDIKENALAANSVGIMGLHLNLGEKNVLDLFR